MRTYERHQFSLSIDGKEYKGNYHEGAINWLHPHPKQDVGIEQLDQLEDNVHQMLEYHGVKEEVETQDYINRTYTQ